MRHNLKIYIFILLLGCCCLSCQSINKAINELFVTREQPEATTRQAVIQYKGINGRLFQVTIIDQTEYFGTVLVYTDRMFFREEMCIGLNQRALWEAGDTAEKLDKHFSSEDNFTLLVDESLFTINSGNLYTESALSYQQILDKNGVVLGSYSDLWYCFNTEPLALGNHHVQLTVTTTTGKQYAYNVEFLITQK